LSVWLRLILLLIFWLQRLAWILLLHHPIEDKIVFIAHSIEEILEQFAEVPNIWLLFKLKASTIVEVDSEFFWVSLGQGFN
jgi:hypothetical protein